MDISRVVLIRCSSSRPSFQCRKVSYLCDHFCSRSRMAASERRLEQWRSLASIPNPRVLPDRLVCWDGQLVQVVERRGNATRTPVAAEVTLVCCCCTYRRQKCPSYTRLLEQTKEEEYYVLILYNTHRGRYCTAGTHVTAHVTSAGRARHHPRYIIRILYYFLLICIMYC